MSKLIEFSDLGIEVTNREQLFKISNNTSSYETIRPSKDIEDYIRESSHYVVIDKRRNEPFVEVFTQLFPSSIVYNHKEGYKSGGCRHLLNNVLHVSNYMHTYCNSNTRNLAPDGWTIDKADGFDDPIGDYILRSMVNDCSMENKAQHRHKPNGVYPKLLNINEFFIKTLKRMITPVSNVDFQSYHYLNQRRQIGTLVRNTIFELIANNNWNVNYIGPEFESFRNICELLLNRNYTGKIRFFTFNSSIQHDYKKQLSSFHREKVDWDYVHRYRLKFENAFCHLFLHHIIKSRSYSIIYVNTLYNIGNWTEAYQWLNIRVVDHIPVILNNSVVFGFMLSTNACSFSVNVDSDRVVYSPKPYDDENNVWTVSILGENIGVPSNEAERIAAKKNGLPNYIYGGVKFDVEALDFNYVTVGLYSLSNVVNSPELIKATLSYDHIFTFPTYSEGDWRLEIEKTNKIFITTQRQFKFNDWIIDAKNLSLEMDTEVVSESVFLQLGKDRAFISDRYQHMVAFRFKQKNYYSDRYMSHLGIRQPSIFNRDRFLTSRLSAYIDRQLTLNSDLSLIEKNHFSGFSGHLIAVEKYFHALTYTMSPMRWANRALSDAIYKKTDRWTNAVGERHSIQDFRNTYAYLGDSINPIFRSNLVTNKYADKPTHCIQLLSKKNHITLQLTTTSPDRAMPLIIKAVEGTRFKYLGRNKFGTMDVALYQTDGMTQYEIVNILRTMDIPCQQTRPYIMHMTIKDRSDIPSTIVANSNNVKVKEIRC
uniref:VP3 n=1 Tax=Bovine group B rotavirus TaxID=35334 RepID=A0A1Q2U382_9REOV|nr:VP3 [Bovine group B rotavirus]